MVDYKDDENIKSLFENKPYITQHMSAKDRNEYKQFKNSRGEKKNAPMVPPINYGMMNPMQQYSPFTVPMNHQMNPMGHQMNPMGQMNPMMPMNQMNQMNQMNRPQNQNFTPPPPASNQPYQQM